MMDSTSVLRDRGVGVGKKLIGDAVEGDVRAGKTFSNADGNNNTGTIPVRDSGGPVVVTPGTANKTQAAGIYDNAITINGDPDLVPGNIRANVNIFGVVGKTEVVDTTEATAPAAAGNILTGKIGYINGVKITGTMANNGAVTINPGTADQTIPAGYHSGGGKVPGDPDLVPGNIRAGSNVFGVAGKTEVVDTTEAVAPAAAGNVLSGKVAYVNGVKVTGSMPNNGIVNVSPGAADQALPAGYISGGTVYGDPDLAAANIRAGVNVFGVAGKTEVVDTTEAAAPVAAWSVISGRVGYVNGVKIVGSMPDNGALGTYTPTTANQNIPAGYTSGGTVAGDADLVPGNIRGDRNIFGVQGSIPIQAAGAQTVTPGTANIVKAAGIYDGAITIAGDPDLVTGNIRAGANIFGVAGKASVVDTADATAAAANVLSGKTAYVNGAKVTGTIPTVAGKIITPGTAAQTAIDAGNYASGAITVAGDADLIPANIRKGTTVFGVTGDGLQYSNGDELTDMQLSAPSVVGGSNALNAGYNEYSLCGIVLYSGYLFIVSKSTLTKRDLSFNIISSLTLPTNYDLYDFIVDDNGIAYICQQVGTITKLDLNTMTVVWSTTINNMSTSNYPTALAFDSTGNVVIAVYGNLGNHNLTKIDPSGTVIWDVIGQFLYAQGVAVDNNDNCYIVGYGNSGNSGTATLMKTDASGNIIWRKTYGDYGSCENILYDKTHDVLYVYTQSPTKRLFTVNMADGSLITDLGASMSNGGAQYGYMILDEANGQLYMEDSAYGHLVQRLDVNGKGVIWTQEAFSGTPYVRQLAQDADFVYSVTNSTNAGYYYANKINKYTKQTII